PRRGAVRALARMVRAPAVDRSRRQVHDLFCRRAARAHRRARELQRRAGRAVGGAVADSPARARARDHAPERAGAGVGAVGGGRLQPQPVYGRAAGYFRLLLGVGTLWRPDMRAIGAPVLAIGALVAAARLARRGGTAAALAAGLLVGQLGFALAIGEDVFLGA